jgi:signal transduction histidine kinase
MHGWGQWYGLVVLALAGTSYLLGRRGAPRTAAAVLGGAEAASIAALVTTHDTLGWLGDQSVLVLGVFCVLAGAYRRLRHELTAQGWSRAGAAQAAARLRERARIAAELHDTVGHELTLLSLRAGGIQVTTADPAVREQAAALRSAAADAITKVRRLVDVLGEDASGGGPGLDELVRRQRAAGTTVHVEGELPGEASDPVRRAAARVVAQALANAAQHAFGEPVRIVIGARDGEVSITVTNPCPPRAPSPRAGSGLAAMGERLRMLGGTLRTERTVDEFRLVASMPRDAEARVTADGTGGMDPEVVVEYGRRRRRAREVLVASVAAPLAALVILATGFYAWAVRDASIEARDFQRLHVGMAQGTAEGILPGRQARLRFGPAAAGCRFYTNGNYPLAYGNYEVCFHAGRVSSITDRTGNSR